MMKKKRVFYLFILVFCHLIANLEAYRFQRESDDDQIFEFTAPLYNLSVEENSIGSKFARSDNATKIGVKLPEKDATCKFRVAEIVGEKSSLFKAHGRQVGDFVFLRIRYKGDNPLNRELKEFYDMLVKATCKRKDANLETTTKIHLTVIDRNDASPIFDLEEEKYEANIEDTIEPFSKVLQVEASDADIGINSAIYFSLSNRSHDFFVEPVTGWLRTLRPLKAGKYELKIKAEDRASRLFYFDDNEVQPSWPVDVVINVAETARKNTKILVETRKIDDSMKKQLAAIITLQNAPEKAKIGLSPDFISHGFEILAEDQQFMMYTKDGVRIPKNSNVTVTVGMEFEPMAGNLRRREVENVTAVVQIQHKSEHTISFLDSPTNLLLTIDEMAPIGKIVGKIQAIVSNPDDISLIRYSISAENTSNSTLPLKIGAKNGLIRVSTKLVYGVENIFNFKISAKLENLKKSVEIPGKLEILDGNNHPPSFSAKWLRQTPVAIIDTQKIGAMIIRVDAQDRDDGENGRIVYKMTSATPNSLKIDAESGEISLATPLVDGENQWAVTIWAVDWGKPLSRSAALNLVFYRNGTKMPSKPKPVIIQELENKKAPVFESFPDVVEVMEDAPIGTIIAKLHANDEDSGYNGYIRYVIHDAENTSDEILSINETSGEISVASDLTKLMKRGSDFVEISMKVSAEDAGNPTTKKTEKTLKLKVLDVNNQAPEFDQPFYQLHITEDTKPSTQLLQVTATDADGSKNSLIRYSIPNIFEIDDSYQYITIDEKSGIIKLKNQLDREQQDVLSFIIQAQDSGSPALSTFVNFTIFVDDINDNAPKCIQSITKARIPEDYPNEAFVTCVTANDIDLGQNGRIRYSFDGPDARKLPFRIDHHTGCVFVHAPDQPLDWHRQAFFNISIEVSDQGEQMLSTNCQLHIELIDIAHNHLAIEFDDIAKEASVYENSPPGTEVIMIEAKEMADEKRKAENVRYSIIGGDGRPYFSIDDKGTVRTTISLDRERQSAHWLTIEARDSAIDDGRMRSTSSSRRRAILHVYVRVLDRNDHRPQPSHPVYFAKVMENSPANVVIIKVEATDADDAGNDAAPPLQYKIERGDPQSFFRIDPTSGYMTTSGSRRLDREKQAEHELWVSICDGGEPQLCSQVAVIVQVLDENDNAPMFTQPVHQYSIRAHHVGEIARIFAIDIDDGENAQLYYNVTDGDSRFTIDENGVIYTNAPIFGDENFQLTVQASDRGTPQQFAATRVVLMGVGGTKDTKKKNKAPEIVGKKSDYVIPISDADQVGLTIGKLEATDPDGDELWWSINDLNFDIRKDSGLLMLARKVEYLKRGEIRLNVSVTDGLDWDHTIVIIQVSRSQKQRPKFSASHYQTEIQEKTAVGTQIYTLKATGEEMGPGTKPLVYSMFSVEDIGQEEKIRIEPSSGNVIVMEALDYEATREIRAIVQVRQGAMKNFANLVVKIGDENDNAPRFGVKEMVAFVDESDPIGSLITTVTAFDADTAENGLITYSLISGNEAGFFELDKLSGELRLATKIDRDLHFESILRIRATDSAIYSLSDEMTVYVRNSNATIDANVKFSRKIYQLSTYDSTPPGTPLTVLHAQHHGAIKYRLHQPCPYFEIHQLSGAVHLAKWLTRERMTTKSVNCTVTAESGDPGETDEAKIVVKIIRTNQHSPIFRKQVYRARIRENSPIGSPVLLADSSPLIISATDNDSGPNALISYRIMSPGDDYFAVDLISGAVRVRKPIDFERIREWRFHVQAFDMGQPPRSSPMPALIIIEILDVNDEPPQFLTTVLQAPPLFLPTANGIQIGRQLAKDADTVGKLRYFLKEHDTIFSVNQTSGWVYVKDAEKLEKKEYRVEIWVSDGVKSASYELVVMVSDTNSGGWCGVEKYEAEVMENETTPKTLVSIGGASGVLVYRIINEHESFMIHPGTGVIATTGIPVDREENQEIRLIVQGKSATATCQSIVVIRIGDKNDNTPMFINLPYHLSVTMSAKVGDVLMTVKAVDKDIGTISYQLKSDNEHFKLIGDKITLAKELVQLGMVTLDIMVVDQEGLNSTEVIRIDIIDKEQPIFEKKNISVVITDKDIDVITVQARSGVDGGLVQYRLISDTDKFRISPISGLIRRTDKLDKEEYQLIVEAFEVTRPRLTARMEVVIRLSVIKEDGPIFDKSSYHVEVPESMAIGEKLVDISAKSEKFGIISYSSDSDVISVDMDTGEVRLAKELDFEKIQKVEAKIYATDRRQVTKSADLVIRVVDINDEAPKFLNSFVTATLDDSATPGQFLTILSVTDMDTVATLDDSKQKLLFKIVDGDETLFDVDEWNGEVSLARMVEDEDGVENLKTLNVSVTDGVFTSYAQLMVELRRSGRRQVAPRFEQSQYVASALENTAVNKSALLTVSVRDGIPPIRYSLGPAIASPTNTKGAWPVRIDKQTGRIHVSRVLNYHNDKLYQIPLVAEDAVGRRAFATLTLSVIDINDKAPVFVLSTYACSMSETAKEGDTVLMVSAMDEDENDTIEYSLINDNDLFQVHPKQGTITVAKKLEHKAGQTFSLAVKATDSANPPHHATTQVEVSIAPEGTPTPRFSNSHYLFTIGEDAAIGNVIGRVQQVEAEIEECRFSLAENLDLPFSVERATGKIIVKSALDREKRAQWRMAIRADAPGGVHAITTVTIDVADVNDNAPAFQGDYERLTISEDAPVGTSVAIFSASDKDEAPSGKLRFSLLKGSEKFTMNEDSGWLTVIGSLDRETVPQYEMVARVTDEGGLNTDLKFSVIVTDVNDSPPIFDQEKYEVEVSRDLGEILKVKITDADEKSDVKMFISSGNEEGVFSIENGSLKVERPDFLKPENRLTLTAFDGVFARSSEVLVKLKPEKLIKCENFDLKLMENSKKGTIVVPESKFSNGYDVHFSLDTADPFVINWRNGIVKIKDETIDFERIKDMEIRRILSNKKKEKICEEVIRIEVINENDNKPIITDKVIRVSIKENLPADKDHRVLIGRVEATDLDDDQLIYELISGDKDGFEVDKDSGVITLIRMLDREEMERFELKIRVSDGKFEDFAMVTVEVADQNDNAPIFDKKEVTMKVMESESVGYKLAQLHAIGGDIGETVTYRLKEANDMVHLDTKTGDLTLAKGLDFEMVKRFEVVVVATDSGSPPLASEARVEVLVMDENDNVPIFDQVKYEAKISENSPIGTKVIQIKASDKDSEHFGSVSYSIISDKEVPFGIDKDGWVMVNGMVDFEVVKRFEMKILAKDGGFPTPLSSTVPLLIHVVDQNDNAPIFEDCNMTAVVQEGPDIGHPVITFNIADADGPENSGPFNLEIKGDGSKLFKIDENVLKTAGKLQHSKKDMYLLTVVAKDAGGRSTDCPITVWIKEESKHAPKLKSLKIRINTIQNELNSGIIGKLSAEDEDSEDLLMFGIVEDSIVGPKKHNFRVDPTSGEIWSEHSISPGAHSFNVTVTDGKFKTLSFVEVLVASIDADTVENAFSMRIRDISVEKFLKHFDMRFRRILAAHLNVHEENIQLVSVQEVVDGGRRRRSVGMDVEVLMTAQRGHGRGYLKPDHVYSRLKQDFGVIEEQSEGIRYQLITEMCTTGVCQRGECRERIDLLEDKWTKITTPDIAFLSPYHTRQAQCQCPDGFTGKRCEIEANQCSKSPCHDYQLCIPSTTDNSYQCTCPLGMQGDTCKIPNCGDGKCLEEAELSVGGDGYFEMGLGNEIETRMEVEIEVKTTSSSGVLMWTGGSRDWHMLAIVDGHVEYSWDAGAGQGVVTSKTMITDGKWHRISISRRQRRTRLMIDDSDINESFSPIGATVLNLHKYSQILVFGAKVEGEYRKTVSHGVSACFRTISVDGRRVPKTRQGLRLFGAAPGCSALTSSPCSEMPCGNGGTCVVNGKGFTCMCPSRYTGDKCEIDTEPCSSQPCPTGIQCIPFYNEYLCKCPNGFTGKHCESRGFDEMESTCTEDTCGPNGRCISIPRQTTESSGFICNCTFGGLLPTPCPDKSGVLSILEVITRTDILMYAGIVIVIIVIAVLICIGCKKCRSPGDPKYGAHCDVPHMRNTRVLMPTVDPPPLPPRGFRNDASFIGSSTNTNRPTVQVRPFTSNRNESRSPSVCGSGKGASGADKFRRHQPTDEFGGSNRVRKSDRKNERSLNDALTSLRGESSLDDWRTSIDSSHHSDGVTNGVQRIAGGGLMIGATELMPVYNDQDYMTMKPRKDLALNNDDSPPPKVPAHAAPPPSILHQTTNDDEMSTSVLYDEPISLESRSFDDIDEEVRIHIN